MLKKFLRLSILTSLSIKSSLKQQEKNDFILFARSSTHNEIYFVRLTQMTEDKFVASAIEAFIGLINKIITIISPRKY